MDTGIFIWFAVCLMALVFILLVRFVKGPTSADRAMVGDAVEVLTDMVLILFAVWSNRSICLDIALVTAILGFLGSLIIGKYLEGKL